MIDYLKGKEHPRRISKYNEMNSGSLYSIGCSLINFEISDVIIHISFTCDQWRNYGGTGGTCPTPSPPSDRYWKKKSRTTPEQSVTKCVYCVIISNHIFYYLLLLVFEGRHIGITNSVISVIASMESMSEYYSLNLFLSTSFFFFPFKVETTLTIGMRPLKTSESSKYCSTSSLLN